jgi:8-oxo-dGTP diphosphatase
MELGIGVKAFIVEDGKLLLLRRRKNDPHNPGQLDLPGGRIQPDESPQEGVARETLEEAGLNVEVICPIEVQHFTRQDGQVINLIFFLCKKVSGEIKLSEEHFEYEWSDLADKSKELPSWLKPVIAAYFKFNLENYV